MISYLRIIFLIVLFCNSSYTYSQQIKKVIGVRINKKDTLISFTREYSKEGNLLSIADPTTNCSTIYKYDEQSRLIKSFESCAESQSSGGTTYDYYQNKVCMTEYSPGYNRINCDSFDTDGSLINNYTYLQYDLKRTSISTIYFYNNKKLVREDKSRIEYIDSTYGDTTLYITKYTYNNHDSLIGYFEINPISNDTTLKVIFTYDPITNLKIKEYKVGVIYAIITNKTYRYNKQGKLVKMNYIEFSGISPKPIIKSKNIYLYKNNHLFKTKQISVNKDGSSKYYNYYENNLRKKSVSYRKWKVINSMNFYYSYW